MYPGYSGTFPLGSDQSPVLIAKVLSGHGVGRAGEKKEKSRQSPAKIHVKIDFDISENKVKR